MRESNSKLVTFSPDLLKKNLHAVQIVMLDAENMVKGGTERGSYDTRSLSEIDQFTPSSTQIKTQKVSAYSISSALNFNSSINIVDVINEAFGSLGNTGTMIFNNLDKIDNEFFGGALGRAAGVQGGLPPLVPKLSYERKTAYGGAGTIAHSVTLLFPFVDDFNKDVIEKVNLLSEWYLPNRMNTDLGSLLGKSTSLLEKKAGDSIIVEGIKAIGLALQDISSDIFKGCFLLEVPIGARNPTRIYIGPEDSTMRPTYCGDWLVNSFGLSTTDFVIYDHSSNCLRPAFVQVTLGLLSWRVTDNKSFMVFNNFSKSETPPKS